MEQKVLSIQYTGLSSLYSVELESDLWKSLKCFTWSSLQLLTCRKCMYSLSHCSWKMVCRLITSFKSEKGFQTAHYKFWMSRIKFLLSLLRQKPCFGKISKGNSPRSWSFINSFRNHLNSFFPSNWLFSKDYWVPLKIIQQCTISSFFMKSLYISHILRQVKILLIREKTRKILVDF